QSSLDYSRSHSLSPWPRPRSAEGMTGRTADAAVRTTGTPRHSRAIVVNAATVVARTTAARIRVTALVRTIAIVRATIADRARAHRWLAATAGAIGANARNPVIGWAAASTIAIRTVIMEIVVTTTGSTTAIIGQTTTRGITARTTTATTTITATMTACIATTTACTATIASIAARRVTGWATDGAGASRTTTSDRVTCGGSKGATGVVSTSA